MITLFRNFMNKTVNLSYKTVFGIAIGVCIGILAVKLAVKLYEKEWPNTYALSGEVAYIPLRTAAEFFPSDTRYLLGDGEIATTEYLKKTLDGMHMKPKDMGSNPAESMRS